MQEWYSPNWCSLVPYPPCLFVSPNVFCAPQKRNGRIGSKPQYCEKSAFYTIFSPPQFRRLNHRAWAGTFAGSGAWTDSSSAPERYCIGIVSSGPWFRRLNFLLSCAWTLTHCSGAWISFSCAWTVPLLDQLFNSSIWYEIPSIWSPFQTWNN